MGASEYNPTTDSIDTKRVKPGSVLRAPDIDDWDIVFSARGSGRINTLWETESGVYVHTQHNTDTRVEVGGNYVCSYNVVQMGNHIKTTLQPQNIDDGRYVEAGFLIDDWPVYASTWCGRTVSVSTDMEHYAEAFSDYELEQIQQAGDHDITFDIKLVSGGRV